MSVIVTRYMGHDIQVDDEGVFTAQVNGNRLEDRHMTKLKGKIREAMPGVRMMQCIASKWGGHNINAVYVSGVEVASDGSLLCLIPPSSGRYQERRIPADEIREKSDQFEREVALANSACEKARQEAEKVRDERIAACFATLPVLTVERVNELIKGEQQRRK